MIVSSNLQPNFCANLLGRLAWMCSGASVENEENPRSNVMPRSWGVVFRWQLCRWGMSREMLT